MRSCTGSAGSGWRCCAWSAKLEGGASSLCARTRGEPSSAHCEQRLSERLTPCPCDPVCACTGMRGHAEKGKGWLAKRLAQRCSRGAKGNPHLLSAYPHAAQRAVPGWRGGLGRVGADLASAGSMRPPPSPARHVSTARLATTKARQETPRHPRRAPARAAARSKQQGRLSAPTAQAPCSAPAPAWPPSPSPGWPAHRARATPSSPDQTRHR